MSAPLITRFLVGDVALLGDEGRPCGVTFAFTERSGGVSEGAYASLNLCDRCGDDAAAVEENRARALGALGLGELAGKLVTPVQVHGSVVLAIESSLPEELSRVRELADQGADAVVCAVPDVPVMLRSADCALVVLVAEGGFAIAHSGWRGTMARISGKALSELCRVVGLSPREVRAYIGPHIGREDFEVSQELQESFVAEFGPKVAFPGRRVDLAYAIRQTLVAGGVDPSNIVDCGVSTPASTDRFYSWRAQQGTCGRNAAIACLARSQKEASR